MLPVNHNTANRVLRAPPGQEDDVIAIQVRDDMSGVYPTVVSFWKPNAAELAALNVGAVVTCSVMGRTMPPIYIGVENAE